jgi:predicted CoA-substrate-specific enzyme activase
MKKSTDKKKFMLGIDVGSTTVKAVLVDTGNDEVLWQDYQRHDTRQAEKVLEFLQLLEKDYQIGSHNCRLFLTGSGASPLTEFIGGKFVQEVNAVSIAIEKFYPEAGSVIELGGQDAKILIYKEVLEDGRRKKIFSMNDKCAGGTGAVIDKISAKLNIPADELCNQHYDGYKIHPVAGKCGVFAETDINGLQKVGVPQDELMASLFEAIVEQNLSVLTRGNTLKPHVLLLGGPNTFIVGMHEAWRHAITRLWRERNILLDEYDVPPEELIRVPDNGQYFAARGAVEFGKTEDADIGIYQGLEQLVHYLEVGRIKKMKATSTAQKGLVDNEEEMAAFREAYQVPSFAAPIFPQGQEIKGFIGIDGGSTSTKAVLMNTDSQVIALSYQLSKGNPISDTIEVMEKLRQQVEGDGAHLEVLGLGTTGYAKDILADVLKADVAIVETVAHSKSALHYYDDVDVICDVGGQDIKIMMLKNGAVKDFKINTQCSAGNGYFLHSTAETFNINLKEYADKAFSAKVMPSFGYGCAVFMQTDIVNFQRQGWRAEEILAGLADVLPKNIWLYVAQIPNIPKLGTKFILQGGTQRNLAAVKAQVDFITSRFAGLEEKPEVTVHKFCGESGAIGAALEATRLWQNGKQTSFIGFDAVKNITFETHRNEDTRCHFCKNLCLRSFIDVTIPGSKKKSEPTEFKSKIPLAPDAQRLIVSNSCERGLVEDEEQMLVIQADVTHIKSENPNLVELAAKAAFWPYKPPLVADSPARFSVFAKQKKRHALMNHRKNIKIGIPRVLNMYSCNPFFSGYFESLGVNPKNLVYSDYTSEQLYKEGNKRGSVDPCFPSKVSLAHIHNLLFTKHRKTPLDIIFFPMIATLPNSELEGAIGHCACPTVTTTPESAKSGFTNELDLFKDNGVRFLNTYVSLDDPGRLKDQMYKEFKSIFGLSHAENNRAVEEGYKALDVFVERKLRDPARQLLKQLEAEQRVGIVLLGRPYHNDPGLNHGILEEFQKRGYPIFTQYSLPTDPEILDNLFAKDIAEGRMAHPTDISDVWRVSYSENSSHKIWVAKYVARHPNLVGLDLSSFKCGHDAPIYTVVEEILEKSGTPYFSFKDIDENKPTGSIKLRVETIDYFLRRYRENTLEENKIYKVEPAEEIDCKWVEN